MDIQDIIFSLAEKAIDELNKNGFMSGGHNGPYYDPETPVRNTAHWATTFAHCYRVTKDDKYYKAVELCGDYLLSKEARPMDATFFCRSNPKKDLSNGTIGQAWAIEGLVSAYKVTGNQKYIELAQQVFLLHPFNERYKLWQVVNVDGSHRSFDMTFNHQLWFAAAGFILLTECENDVIKQQCHAFMNDMPNKFKIYKSGLVKHGITNKIKIKDQLRNVFDYVNYQLSVLKTKKNMLYKENGYHLFNVYAFALIKQTGNDFSVFNSPDFKIALQYCVSQELHNWLEHTSREGDINNMSQVEYDKSNIYAYPYNAPAFELSYIYHCFKEELGEQEALIERIISKQLSYNYDSKKQSFSKNTEDVNTLNARIYEYVRFSDLI
jgi:ribosomal 30S subunit maturation factor RimM